MIIPPHWFALAAAVTLTNAVVLGVMGRRERSRPLQLWAYAWSFWTLAVIPLSLLDACSTSAWLSLACGVLWVASSLCFVRGTYDLMRRAMPKAWLAIAVVCVAVAFALGIGAHGEAGMFPLVGFQSVGLVATGVLLTRNSQARTGGWMAGGALILLGVHLLDAPLAARHPPLMLWGFVVAVGLEVVGGLGMVMLHYEHALAELDKTRSALEHSRRIESLGRIAGGVAHDFNNMLTVIQGNIELIRHGQDREEELDDSIQAIAEAVGRAERLTSQLLAFGRRSVIQPEAVDLQGVISSTVEFLKQVVPKTIRVVFESGEGDFEASIDRGLIEQIVLNLVTNARDAILDGGTITVTLTREMEPENVVVLRVTDDGIGMNDEQMEQVFEPFFTTKPRGRGTGLGLAAVQGAISQLQGEVRVRSALGEGSTFEVRLPWIAPDQRATDRPSTGGREHYDIVLVDDDPQVRAVTARMLETLGHRVRQASSGAEALSTVAARPCDLVLSDAVMPNMGGGEVLSKLSIQSPAVAVALMSGYPVEEAGPIRSMNILTKPFDSDTLERFVREAVSAHRRDERLGPGVVRSAPGA